MTYFIFSTYRYNGLHPKSSNSNSKLNPPHKTRCVGGSRPLRSRSGQLRLDKQRGLLGSLNTVPNSTPNKPAQSSSNNKNKNNNKLGLAQSSSNNKNKNNNKLGGVSGSTASSASASASASALNAEQKTKNTIRSSQPTGAYNIRLWNLFPTPEGRNFKTIGEGYWKTGP
eukprot:jgi/Psemu1/42030/gm1.42030_g